MKIDIWSDIMCPFCYIGKRKLEGALSDFEHSDKIELVWHSFQLDPGMQSQPGKNLNSYLAERKGQTLEWAEKAHAQMTKLAASEGLTYNFDKAVVANSFDAHRLIQLAKKHGLGTIAEERIFKAYFTEGKNISDHNTLMQLGMDIGLNAVEIGEMLHGNAFADEVRSDIETANKIGVTGVPFFVINNRYAISGAQPVDIFKKSLQQAWQEFYTEFNEFTIAEGDGCSIDSGCTVPKNN